MNLNEIGKFIAKCRKDKKMTQQELAKKINVTDRAVSNWETGRRLPDYSIIESLCRELDITINELFACKKIMQEEYKRISDNTLFKILKSNDNYVKKQKLVRIIDLCISFIAIIILSIYSIINNKQSLFYIIFVIIFLIIVEEFVIHIYKRSMDKETKQVDGKIIKSKKLWWLKINSKPFRTTSLDGAKFPSAVKIEYFINENRYVGKKILNWDDKYIQEGQDVVVTYNEEKPQKVLKLTKKIN